jgi:asparagine synthase (glutamine-hydrolysing)
VSHFNGMFAFAVWDVTRRRLFLARDRMGEKPLYYYAGAGLLVFGSELRAVLVHPAVARELSLDSLSEYLAFEYVPDPRTIIAGVAKLEPGCTLSVTPADHSALPTRYWDLSFAADTNVTEREWEERLVGQLEMSIRQRLVSDVPVGFFLSGGVDSSAVVALGARVSGGRVKTFNLGFDTATHDERPFARLVAEHCATEHHEIVFTGEDIVALLDRVGELMDEPLVDGSFLPTYALSRAARRAVTVVLTGDGADELFCGYPTFLADRGARAIDRLPAWVLRTIGKAVDQLPPSPRYGSVEFLLKQFFRALPYPPDVRTQLLLGGLAPEEIAALLAPEISAALRRDPHAAMSLALRHSSRFPPLEQLIYQHCKYYLAGQNLANVDRATMACGLEARAPFLDHALVELAGRMPARLKLRGLSTKYVLKRALRELLPPAILRRRKQGFGVPMAAWLRGPLRSALEERLRPDRVAKVGLFNPVTTWRFVVEHLTGKRDHRKVLWSLLVFDAWRDAYLPGARWN